MARVIRSAPWTLVSHVLVNKLASRHAPDPLQPETPETPADDLSARRAAAQARAQEQRRISRLLHDEIGQSLTALNVQLAVLRGRSRGAVQAQLKSAQGLLESALTQVQRLSQDLHPSAVEDIGLVPALRSHIKNFSQKAALTVYFKADDALQFTDIELNLAIFRSVRALLADLEAAAAAQTCLSLNATPDALVLEARARISRRRGNNDEMPDVSAFHEHVLIAGGSVNYRAHRNQAIIAARFPITDPGQI
jgi:glucose-6-phosphate-specific signal transduction histidine kinase